MQQSQEGRVEELSKKAGGRFKLTALIQKQMREYVRGGGTFMPGVKNTHDLVNYILDEIEEGKISLVLLDELQPEPDEELGPPQEAEGQEEGPEEQ